MNKRRRVSFILGWLTILAIIAASFFTGCSSSSTPPASTTISVTSSSTAATSTASNTTKTGTSSAQTYNLKFVDYYNPGAKDALADDKLGSLLTSSTGGKLNITFYHNTLGKPGDFLNLLNEGGCDIANLTPGNYPNQFPMETALELPGLGFKDRAQRIDIMWKLLDEGYFTALSKYKVLAFNPTPVMSFYFVKQVNSVDGMKGLRLRASDKNVLNLIGQIGGVPTSISSSDVYMSLQRGVLDGVYTAYENILQAKLYEVVKYNVSNPITQGCMYIVMNKSVWDSLPQDVQAGIDQAIKDYKSAYLAEVQENDKIATKLLEDQGIQVSSFNETELAKIMAAADTVKAEVLKNLGPQCNAMFDEAIKLQAEYK